MAKSGKKRKVCIATSFSSSHDYEPGTEADARRLESDLWEVCRRSKKHWIHDSEDLS